MNQPQTIVLIGTFLLLLALSVTTSVVGQKAQMASTPDGVVRELYRAHRNGHGHVFDKDGRKLQQKFFDAKLATLIWKDLTETPEGDVGNLDFDPLYNAQDFQIRNFVIGAASVTGDKATVPVSFSNSGRKERLKFSLVKADGVWKISNIDYGEGYNLVGILSEKH